MPDANGLILHQYPVSPFSEKVRVVMGIKDLAWAACNQPVIMPKPDLVALTGGYRRIPVLQIGADLYFDSARILEELDNRYPDRPAFGTGAGIASALLPCIEGTLFMALVGSLFGGDWDYDDAFTADRSTLIGRPFDPAAMAAAVPALEREIRRHFALLELQLGDGRPFMTGLRAEAIDAMIYSQVIFARWGKGRTARLIDEYPLLRAWEGRVAGIGHGKRGADVSGKEAIAIAGAASPAAITSPSVPRDGDPRPGDTVRFKYADASSPVLEGELLHIDDRNLSIAPTATGSARVHIHMPRTAGDFTS